MHDYEDGDARKTHALFNHPAGTSSLARLPKEGRRTDCGAAVEEKERVDEKSDAEVARTERGVTRVRGTDGQTTAE
jgi:hypothetical protein